MPIQHTFNLVTPDGQTHVSFAAWIQSLSAEEQTAYATVFAAQRALEQQQIANGELIMTDAGKKVYSDAAVEKAKLGQFTYALPEWQAWFVRYQNETGITLDITVALI